MDGAGSQEVCSDLSAFKAQRAFGIAVSVPERLPMKRHPHRGIIVAGHPTSLRLEAEFRCRPPAQHGPPSGLPQLPARDDFFQSTLQLARRRHRTFGTFQPVRRQA